MIRRSKRLAAELAATRDELAKLKAAHARLERNGVDRQRHLGEHQELLAAANATIARLQGELHDARRNKGDRIHVAAARLATRERDDARRQVAALEDRLAELQAANEAADMPPGYSRAERDMALAIIRGDNSLFAVKAALHGTTDIADDHLYTDRSAAVARARAIIPDLTDEGIADGETFDLPVLYEVGNRIGAVQVIALTLATPDDEPDVDVVEHGPAEGQVGS